MSNNQSKAYTFENIYLQKKISKVAKNEIIPNIREEVA